MRIPTLLFFTLLHGLFICIPVNAWRTLTEDFLTVIFVGKTGSGKSTSANTLLKANKFQVSGGTESVTKYVQFGDIMHEGQRYRVMDTPGYLDVDLTATEITDQIAEWGHSSLHGVDVFLFIMEYGRVGSAHWESFQIFKNCFGQEAMNRTAVLLTQLRPSNLPSEYAVGNMTSCCKPGGAVRQACCEILDLKNLGQPIIAIGDPVNDTRRIEDRQLIFDAIRQVKLNNPTPYQNEIFHEIHANRSELLHEISLLKFNKHRMEMHAMYESFYSPEIDNGVLPQAVSPEGLWDALKEFQKAEQSTQDEEAVKWGYRFVASMLLSWLVEWLLSSNYEPLAYIERLYRASLLFSVYAALCLTDHRSYGIRYFLSLLPPLLIFDITNLMDLYFKLDDVLPLLTALLIHCVYIVTHRLFRYFFGFFEGLYLAALLCTLVVEILRRGMFEPPPGEYPIEQACFCVMVASTFLFFCQVDQDHELTSEEVPEPVWRFRMAWRPPIRTRFEAKPTVQTQINEEEPEGGYPLRFRRVDSPWELESFREERRERLIELSKSIILSHKERGNTDTVKALQELPPTAISLPTPDTEIPLRLRHASLALINIGGCALLALDHSWACAVAALDLILLLRIAKEFYHFAFAADPEAEVNCYKKEWAVCKLELKSAESSTGRSKTPSRQRRRRT